LNNQEEVGLGLSISKQIVKIYNGDIWFSSEHLRGSTFSFSFESEQLTRVIQSSTNSNSDANQGGAYQKLDGISSDQNGNKSLTNGISNEPIVNKSFIHAVSFLDDI
jgi:hypothetical protein